MLPSPDSPAGSEKVLLLLHNAADCNSAAAGSTQQPSQPGRSKRRNDEFQITSGALDAWLGALLVVSSWNLELLVQHNYPELQEQLSLWSMPLRADVLPQQSLQQLPDAEPDTPWLLQQRQTHCKGNYVISFGNLPGGDKASATALLTAAASTSQTLVFLGPSRPLEQLCGGGKSRDLLQQQRQQLAYTSVVTARLPEEAVWVQLLQGARYVALLHMQEGWQDRAAGTVLLGKRLILYNMTQPHQPYRWLRPFATLVEPSDNAQLLVQQLVAVLGQEPPPMQPLQKRDVSQLAVYWDVPLLPAALMMMPVSAGNGSFSPHPMLFHQRCRGSVVLAVSFAYSEVLDMMRAEPPAPERAPMHKYWFMPNLDISNKWEVNNTVRLYKTADRLLCKTWACHKIMQAWINHNYHLLPAGEHDVRYMCFSTPDPTAGPGSSGIVMDYSTFLHAMGKSPFKNTQAVLQAWAENPDFPPLTITTYEPGAIQQVQQYLNNSRGLGYATLNVRLVTDKMAVLQLNDVINSIGNHVCPSEKEGFGHYINQARAAGALLLTTDYPPMREFAGAAEDFGILCPYHELFDTEVEMFSAVNNPYLPSLSARLTSDNVALCVRRVLAMSVKRRRQIADRGRHRFLQELHIFHGVLQSLKVEAKQFQSMHLQ
eukprot:gene5669-5907_t